MCSRGQLVDEIHPVRSVMPEEVFGRPLLQPLYALLDSVLATWDIRSNEVPVMPDEGSFLAKAHKMGLQSIGPCCRDTLIMRLFQKEEVLFVLRVFSSIKQRVCFCFHVLQKRVLRRIKPPTTSLVLGTLAD